MARIAYAEEWSIEGDNFAISYDVECPYCRKMIIDWTIVANPNFLDETDNYEFDIKCQHCGKDIILRCW